MSVATTSSTLPNHTLGSNPSFTCLLSEFRDAVGTRIVAGKRKQSFVQRIDLRIIEVLVFDRAHHLDAGMNVTFHRPNIGNTDRRSRGILGHHLHDSDRPSGTAHALLEH